QARAVEPPRGRGTAAGCAWSAFLIVPIDATPFRCRQPLSSICQPGDGTLGHSCSASVEWPNPPREFPNIFTSRGSASSSRFDDVDARFAAVDARLDRMEARISARLDSVIEKLDTHFLINKNHFDHHTVILHEHDDRLKDLERQTGT